MSEETSTLIKRNLLRSSYEASAFVITRYPYLCAVLLMVTTAEEAKTTKFDRSTFNYIYAQLGLYFFSATIMSFDMFGLKRWLALVMVGQTVVLSYNEYRLTGEEQVAMRLLTRNLAVIGCYICVAGGIAKNKGANDKNKHMLSFGRQLIGAYAMLTAVLLWNSDNEFNIHVKVLPGGLVTTYTYVAVYILCSISIYSGYEVVRMCKLLACVMLAITIIVDMDVEVWSSNTGMKKWKIMTIAARNVPAMSTLLLIRDGYY